MWHPAANAGHRCGLEPAAGFQIRPLHPQLQFRSYARIPGAAPGTPDPNIRTPLGTGFKTARGCPKSEPETRNAESESAFGCPSGNTVPGTRRIPEFGIRWQNDIGTRTKNPPCVAPGWIRRCSRILNMHSATRTGIRPGNPESEPRPGFGTNI